MYCTCNHRHLFVFKSRNVILLDEVPQELISVVSQKVQRPNPFALNPDSPWQEGQTLVGGSVLLSKTVPVPRV